MCASVILGKHEGAMAIQKTCTRLNSSAHRLLLAVCDVAHSCSWFQRFEKILNQAYALFSRSTVHTMQPAEMQQILSLPQLKLQRAIESRWLSLANALVALHYCFDAVSTKKAILEMLPHWDWLSRCLACNLNVCYIFFVMLGSQKMKGRTVVYVIYHCVSPKSRVKNRFSYF